MLNSQDSAIYFSDAINEFLNATVEYYDRQDVLELMYETDYFATHSIDNFVIKAEA